MSGLVEQSLQVDVNYLYRLFKPVFRGTGVEPFPAGSLSCADGLDPMSVCSWACPTLWRQHLLASVLSIQSEHTSSFGSHITVLAKKCPSFSCAPPLKAPLSHRVYTEHHCQTCPFRQPLHFLKGTLYLKTAQHPVVAQLVRLTKMPPSSQNITSTYTYSTMDPARKGRGQQLSGLPGGSTEEILSRCQ